MALSPIITAVVTAGTNSHATTVAEINAFRSDFCTPGITGTFTNTSGVSPATGSYAVNAQVSPAMFVDITAGSAYITATPAGQTSQLLRAYMAANSTSYAISANASGSTKYDWIYLQVDPTKANNPASDASDVTAFYTSRSSSNTADNGSPPTYGLLLAVVTVANSATSISNANIADRRYNAALAPSASSAFDLDYVRSGCVWSGDSYASSLNASMTGGYVRIGGVTLIVAPVVSRAFTASKDTYVDLSNNGDGTAAFTYTTVSNNAASPALSAGSIRIAIIITGSSNIAAATSVNQGQESRVLPIASSIPYTVTDSLGNLICCRDPQNKLIGYRQIISTLSGLSGSTGTPVVLTGLSCPVIVPPNRKIKITLQGNSMYLSTAATAVLSIWDGATVGGGTKVQTSSVNTASSSYEQTAETKVVLTPSSSSKTYIGAIGSSSGTQVFTASAASPAYIMVELE